jgi:hypothetical protein
MKGEALQGLTVEELKAALSLFEADKYQQADPAELMKGMEAAGYIKNIGEMIMSSIVPEIAAQTGEMLKAFSEGETSGMIRLEGIHVHISLVAAKFFVVGALAGRAAATKQLLGEIEK